MPVLQDLHHIDHVEPSPCHHTSLTPGKNEATYLDMNWLVDPPTLVITNAVVDYLNAGWWIT